MPLSTSKRIAEVRGVLADMSYEDPKVQRDFNPLLDALDDGAADPVLGDLLVMGYLQGHLIPEDFFTLCVALHLRQTGAGQDKEELPICSLPIEEDSRLCCVHGISALEFNRKHVNYEYVLNDEFRIVGTAGAFSTLEELESDLAMRSPLYGGTLKVRLDGDSITTVVRSVNIGTLRSPMHNSNDFQRRHVGFRRARKGSFYVLKAEYSDTGKEQYFTDINALGMSLRIKTGWVDGGIECFGTTEGRSIVWVAYDHQQAMDGTRVSSVHDIKVIGSVREEPVPNQSAMKYTVGGVHVFVDPLPPYAELLSPDEYRIWRGHIQDRILQRASGHEIKHMSGSWEVKFSTDRYILLPKDCETGSMEEVLSKSKEVAKAAVIGVLKDSRLDEFVGDMVHLQIDSEYIEHGIKEQIKNRPNLKLTTTLRGSLDKILKGG